MLKQIINTVQKEEMLVNVTSNITGFLALYLTIIPWARVGYEMIDSQRGA